MAAAVVYSKNSEGTYSFFIGKESSFLRDTESSVKDLEYHAFKKGESMKYKKKHFSQIAKDLTLKLEKQVQFDTPRQSKKNSAFTEVRFRVVPDEPKYGIVKGGEEDADISSVHIAQREFNEECADVSPKLSEFKKMGPSRPYAMYSLDATDYARTIEQSIVSRFAQQYGELFDSQFMSYQEVCSLWTNLNRISKDALKTFFSKHGLVAPQVEGRGRRRTSSSR
jgi:hypothetical protein